MPILHLPINAHGWLFQLNLKALDDVQARLRPVVHPNQNNPASQWYGTIGLQLHRLNHFYDFHWLRL